MTGRILRISFLYIIFFITAGINAQILEPVKWSFSTEQISDTEFDLVFKADIETKWHLYSQDIPMTPPATSFTFEQSDAYELVGETKEESDVIEEYDPNFEMVLKYFAFEAVFKQRVKILSSAPVKITGSLEFMCCDDTRCLPPTDVDFAFDINTGQGTSSVPAQKILQPVTWEITTKYLENRTFDLFFTATIDEGYHLYSLNVPEDGPLPTEFIFENPEGFELVGGAVEVTTPFEEYDDVFEMNIKYFEHEATFRQTIKLVSDDEELPVVGEIAYMVCNDVGCVALYEDVELLFDGQENKQVIHSL